MSELSRMLKQIAHDSQSLELTVLLASMLFLKAGQDDYLACVCYERYVKKEQ